MTPCTKVIDLAYDNAGFELSYFAKVSSFLKATVEDETRNVVSERIPSILVEEMIIKKCYLLDMEN